jgi:hypothetical protein
MVSQNAILPLEGTTTIKPGSPAVDLGIKVPKGRGSLARAEGFGIEKVRTSFGVKDVDEELEDHTVAASCVKASE